MAEYEFDAHIVVESGLPKEVVAHEILEHCLNADIAISLHEQGTLNIQSLLAEGAIMREALEEISKRQDPMGGEAYIAIKALGRVSDRQRLHGEGAGLTGTADQQHRVAPDGSCSGPDSAVDGRCKECLGSGFADEDETMNCLSCNPGNVRVEGRQK